MGSSAFPMVLVHSFCKGKENPALNVMDPECAGSIWPATANSLWALPAAGWTSAASKRTPIAQDIFLASRAFKYPIPTLHQLLNGRQLQSQQPLQNFFLQRYSAH